MTILWPPFVGWMFFCSLLFRILSRTRVINWNVNKHLSLGATVINFLNQKGASGTINGSELITKEEAGNYAGRYMSGNYLRPFTVEFSAGIKF